MATRMRRGLLTLTAAAVALLSIHASFCGLPLGHAAPGGQEDELPRKGCLGVRLAPLTDVIRAREQLAEGAGVQIEAVLPDTTAAEGNLRPGDILLAMDGKPISSVIDPNPMVAAMRVGQQFAVTLQRTGQRISLVMMLKACPRDQGETFEVLYHHVVSGGARIRTIVSQPHAPGKHPVFFLIQGLGEGVVDRPLSEPDPYSQILNAFANSDYVTVRVEKPGLGDSEGRPYADIDFQTELDTYRQALLAVRKYSFVDENAVFIFGHSMGGVFGPILASEIPLRGIAVYGAVVKTWTEYYLENWRRQMTLFGTDPVRLDGMLRDMAAALHYLLIEQKPPDEILRVRPDLLSMLATLVQAGRIDGRSPIFWAQLAATNLPAYWVKGNAAVLAIWGRNDYFATEADHPLIAEIVNTVRPGKGTYVALEGSDHGFRKTTSMQDSFARRTSPGYEFNPQIITTLREWMEKVRTGR